MIPRFQDVPQHWRYPVGPYRQAPPEYGGEWWLVNPFTGTAPWANQAMGPAETLPTGFEEIFGARPKSEDFRAASNPSLAFRIATTVWEQDLRYFKTAGFPEWAPAEAWNAAKQSFVFWGMGEPRHYEGRYGWVSRFTQSQIPDYDVATWTALNGTHLVVAQYQIRLVQKGIVPGMRHPFVPPSVWPSGIEEKEVA